MNRCIDAGREGCPCTLAESGNCLLCSRLFGGTCNDCNWQGICIYSLFVQNGYQSVPPRCEQILQIDEVRTYATNFRVFVLHADRGFCQKAQTAGAYVFAKTEGDGSWHGVPISVLKSEPDKGLLHLGICACGPKTTRIFETAERFLKGSQERLSIRGVYYNALSGQRSLAEDPSQTYIFGKGIAMAPLRNFLDGGERYVKYLKNLQFYVDLDKVGLDFFKDYFGDLPVDAIEVRDFAREGLCSLDDLDRVEENIANVFALTSPYYADQIQRAAGSESPLVRPTEGNMCCGEGICGACTYSDEVGRTIRRCKDAR